MVFPFRQIILPIALEESISETHQFWKESGSVEKFGRDSNISLSFANINQCIFFQDYVSSKQNGERISMKHCLFLPFKGLSLAISNSAFPRLLVQGDASYPSMKKFYHIPSLALFTAAVFICRLLVNLRPASQEAVIGKNLTYFDLLGCLFVFFLG